MIDDLRYKEVLDNGLLLDHFYLLCSIHNGKKTLDNKRIRGMLNLLTKKGYLEKGELTEKGIDLVQNCDISTSVAETDSDESTRFDEWVKEVHSDCERRIFHHTGSIQVRSKINKSDKKGYPFLCNETDLGKVLSKAIRLYRLKDYDKIKKTILDHIDRCAESNNWFPLLQYYIIKFSASQMVTDMSSTEEIIQESSSKQRFV